mmetsp:Transcript_12316/g.33947  ORF Transcript_12316/g.33947 Transcript_12316/m.33947 type:complete len:221 (+) Transcript_12316:239-901(+)
MALEEGAEETNREDANLPGVPVRLARRDDALCLAFNVLDVVLDVLIVIFRVVGRLGLDLIGPPRLPRPRRGFANLRTRPKHLNRQRHQRVQVRLGVLSHHLQQVTRRAKKTGRDLTPGSNQRGHVGILRQLKPRVRHRVAAGAARGDHQRVEPGRVCIRHRHPVGILADIIHIAHRRGFHRGNHRVNQRYNLRRVQFSDPPQRRDSVRREPTGPPLQPRE